MAQKDLSSDIQTCAKESQAQQKVDTPSHDIDCSILENTADPDDIKSQ